MAKITLSYPDTGLTISISVKNRDTGVEDFSGTMTEVGATREYIYDFIETVDTDYVYVATVAGYSNMSGVVYRDGGGLTTEQVSKLDRIYTNADAKISNINVRPIGYDGGKLDAIYKAIKEIKEVDEEGILKEIRESIPEEVDLSPVLQRLKNLDKIESSVNSIVKMEEEKKKKHEQEEEEKEQEEKEENDEIEEALELVDKEIENSILETIKEVEKEHENAIKEAIKNLKNGN